MGQHAAVSDPTGRVFLAGEVGALSRWAKITPNGTIPVEGIEVIAKEEARAYAIEGGLDPARFAGAGFSLKTSGP